LRATVRRTRSSASTDSGSPAPSCPRATAGSRSTRSCSAASGWKPREQGSSAESRRHPRIPGQSRWRPRRSTIPRRPARSPFPLIHGWRSPRRPPCWPASDSRQTAGRRGPACRRA
jgi:hypothetical protein